MLKKTITFEDFLGNKRTEDFFFHLTEEEIATMELSELGGMNKMIDRVISEQDNRKIIEIFKDMINKSYGVVSPDGRKFMKSPEILAEFKQTQAYSDLFMELASDSKKAAEFVNGIIPKKAAEKIREMVENGNKVVELPATNN